MSLFQLRIACQCLEYHDACLRRSLELEVGLGSGKFQLCFLHVWQGQFHDLQGLLQGGIAWRGLCLVITEDADQLDVMAGDIGSQCSVRALHVAAEQAFHQGHAGFIAPRCAGDRRATCRVHDGFCHGGGGVRVLAGDQAAIDHQLRHHQWRFLPLRATLTQCIL